MEQDEVGMQVALAPNLSLQELLLSDGLGDGLLLDIGFEAAILVGEGGLGPNGKQCSARGKLLVPRVKLRSSEDESTDLASITSFAPNARFAETPRVLVLSQTPDADTS